MHAKGFRGEGQTVAVVEQGGFKRSDIVAFGKCFGVEPPPTTVQVVGTEQAARRRRRDDARPRAADRRRPWPRPHLRLRGGRNVAREHHPRRRHRARRPGHRPDVISISLGICEPQIASALAWRDALDDIFAVAGGAGISVLVSAGDQGSTGCRGHFAETGETTALPLEAVSLPCLQPLRDRGRRHQPGAEQEEHDQGRGRLERLLPQRQRRPDRRGRRWRRQHPLAAHPLVAGRGSPATAPAARCPTSPPSPTASPATPTTARRTVHQRRRSGPRLVGVGGTSAAAPLTAAGIALANQYAEKHGEPTLGFLNPLIYQLGASAKTRARRLLRRHHRRQQRHPRPRPDGHRQHPGRLLRGEARLRLGQRLGLAEDPGAGEAGGRRAPAERRYSRRSASEP